jgi:hypothetical protein
MIRALRRTTNIIFALLLAVFSVNLSGVLTLQNAAADKPAGNNGTVKIGEFDADNGNANDPHVGCSLDVKFFGFDEGTRNGTVTFEAQAPTAGQLASPIGPQPVTFTGSGPGNNLDYTKTYTLAFTGAPQQNQGYHVKATVTVDGAQGNDTKSKTFWVEGCGPTVITPATPTFIEECGSQNDKYVIPQTNGVIYQVKINNGSFQTVPANTYTVFPAGAVVVVKALPVDNTVILDGTTSWSFDFSTAKCEVTATTPEKIDVCGTDNDKYVIPSTPHVTYKVRTSLLNYDVKVAGTYSLNTFQKLFGVKIIAEADAGYTLTGQKTWDFDYSSRPCEITAAAPTKIDECGTANDKYIIPESEHVKYYVNLSPIAKPAGEYTAGHIVGIIAVPDPGYVITSQFAWVFVYTNTACPVSVTPGEVTSVNPCGTDQDGFTIPSTTGVIYKNGDEVLTPGFHPATGTVTIVAEAAAGYVLTEPASWTFTYTNEACPPEPCTPTMVTLQDLTLLSQTQSDDDCPIYNGNQGGETPTPKPAVPAGIELPETGANEGNALAKAFTLLIAGLTTYGIMFFLINRRQLSKK